MIAQPIVGRRRHSDSGPIVLQAGSDERTGRTCQVDTVGCGVLVASALCARC